MVRKQISELSSEGSDCIWVWASSENEGLIKLYLGYMHFTNENDDGNTTCGCLVLTGKVGSAGFFRCIPPLTRFNDE
jgi:hypothetical protein